jgi:hypothetical protein
MPGLSWERERERLHHVGVIGKKCRMTLNYELPHFLHETATLENIIDFGFSADGEPYKVFQFVAVEK